MSEKKIILDLCGGSGSWSRPYVAGGGYDVGHLREYMGPSTMIFQPWEYGDPWTKRTELWGTFTPPKKLYERWEDVPDKLPLYTRPGRGKPNFAYLHKSAQSLIPQLAWAKPKSDADFRAITPPGFAQAFYEANP